LSLSHIEDYLSFVGLIRPRATRSAGNYLSQLPIQTCKFFRLLLGQVVIFRNGLAYFGLSTSW
jgi:hypothetical protein